MGILGAVCCFLVFDMLKKHFGGPGVAAGLLALVAALNIPDGTPISKNYMLFLSASMLSNGIYTLLISAFQAFFVNIITMPNAPCSATNQ